MLLFLCEKIIYRRHYHLVIYTNVLCVIQKRNLMVWDENLKIVMGTLEFAPETIVEEVIMSCIFNVLSLLVVSVMV